jgi:LuxR family maltose regulon positive regulatory protein
MPDTLLTTKLTLPPSRKGIVSRPRLIEKLNAGLGANGLAYRKFTLISAPAGFGKTTLLVEWLRQTGLPVAWLSLDEGDNALVRLFTYLVATMQKIDAGVGHHTQGLLQSPQLPPVKSLVEALVNDTPPSPFILALDDFHLLEERTALEAIRFLLQNLPTHMRLVIATRKDPPLPLARLRSIGHMTEIRARNLRFTQDEAAQFLNDVMGLDVSAKDIATLEARTEGWIAGLHLAAYSLHAYEDTYKRAAFIRAFAGDNRHVMDYLISEVLSQQSEAVRNFLLHTAILERFCGSLCDAVAYESKESGASQEVLEYLDKANLFIVPLDNRREWYRYHHLFSDLLRRRLELTQPTISPQLHLRASAWYEQQGLSAEAVHHALAAQDFERATTLIEPLAMKHIADSKLTTILRWLSKLPDELVNKRPWLCVARAWACLLSGNMDAVDSLLHDAEVGLSETTPETFLDYPRIVGHLETIRAVIARWQGDYNRSIELSLSAFEDLPEESMRVHSALSLNLGTAYAAVGDLESAKANYEESLAIGQRARNYYAALTAISNLSLLQVKQGHLHKAESICQQSIRMGTHWGGGQPLPATGRCYIFLGTIYYEWNDIDKALDLLTRGIELGEQSGEEFIVLGGKLAMARLGIAQGKIRAAFEAFAQAQEIHSRATREQEMGEVSDTQARLWIAQGDLDTAFRWANEHIDLMQQEANHLYFDGYLGLARILIANSQPGKVPGLLTPLLEAAENTGRMGDAIEILVLLALAHQAQDDMSQALSLLERALSLAEPEGYFRTFVDEGPPMARLLYEAANRGIAAEYCGRLLAAFPAADPSDARPLKSVGDEIALIEPLSQRELEVLRLIDKGMSNREIAQEMILALDTIKGYTRRIYGKLGVHNRTHAVAKALTLGILPSE